MVKLQGKKWIVIGSKNADDGIKTNFQGRITIWERRTEKPKLKVFKTFTCLDGRFWLKLWDESQEFDKIAFIDLPKEEANGVDEQKKETYYLRIYDFSQEKLTHTLEFNWQIGNVIFTKHQQRLIVQSHDGQYIYVYSLNK